MPSTVRRAILGALFVFVTGSSRHLCYLSPLGYTLACEARAKRSQAAPSSSTKTKNKHSDTNYTDSGTYHTCLWYTRDHGVSNRPKYQEPIKYENGGKNYLNNSVYNVDRCEDFKTIRKLFRNIRNKQFTI